MESIHVRLEISEALNAKRNILASEVHLLNIQKKFSNYLTLRKKELDVKEKIRSKMAGVLIKINSLKKSLPRVYSPKKEEIERTKIQKEKNTDLEQELKDIQMRLARLNA